jgi:hypothetical protein
MAPARMVGDPMHAYLGMAAVAALFLATPALANQSTFDIDFQTCIGAQAQAAAQLHVPMTLSVNTGDRRDFSIATNGGVVTISCDRIRNTLTVITPPGVSIDPYIQGGGNS